MQKPDVVIFDMDGTSVRHLNPYMLSVMEFLDDVSFNIKRLASKCLKRRENPPEQNKKPKLLVHRALHKFRRKPVEQIVAPCPGIYDLLRHLKSNDIPAAIVSSGLGRGYGYDILVKFGLDQYFSAFVFREDLKHCKPHPEPILRALESLKRKKKKDEIIWFIGDRHKDIKAAIAADKIHDGTIIPIAYALNAAFAVIEEGLSQEHIIMSHFDICEKIKEIEKHTLNKSSEELITQP